MPSLRARAQRRRASPRPLGDCRSNSAWTAPSVADFPEAPVVIRGLEEDTPNGWNWTSRRPASPAQAPNNLLWETMERRRSHNCVLASRGRVPRPPVQSEDARSTLARAQANHLNAQTLLAKVGANSQLRPLVGRRHRAAPTDAPIHKGRRPASRGPVETSAGPCPRSGAATV